MFIVCKCMPVLDVYVCMRGLCVQYTLLWFVLIGAICVYFCGLSPVGIHCYCLYAPMDLTIAGKVSGGAGDGGNDEGNAWGDDLDLGLEDVELPGAKTAKKGSGACGVIMSLMLQRAHVHLLLLPFVSARIASIHASVCSVVVLKELWPVWVWVWV